MHLNELNRKIVTQVFNHPDYTNDLNKAVLSLHESATKFWCAAASTKQDRVAIERRVANTYISACYTAHVLGIENVEEIISRRIGELALQE